MLAGRRRCDDLLDQIVVFAAATAVQILQGNLFDSPCGGQLLVNPLSGKTRRGQSAWREGQFRRNRWGARGLLNSIDEAKKRDRRASVIEGT